MSETEQKSTEQQLSELNAKYERERNRAQRFDGELEDVNRKLKGYKELGDVEDVQSKLQELDTLKKEKATTNPEDLEALLKEKEVAIRGEAQKAIADREAKINELSTQLHEIQVVNKAWDAIGKEFTSDAGKLLKDHLRKNLTLSEDGQIAVKGKDGKPVYIDGVKLKTVSDFAEELKTEYPSLVADKSISGTMKTNGITRTDSGEKILDFNSLKSLSASEIREQARIRAEKQLNNN